MSITIRSDKDIPFIVLFLFAATVCVSWILYGTSNTIYIPFLFGFFCSIIIMRYWIALGRTLVLTSDGIVISFLWFRKKILWTQIQLKQIFRCENGFGPRISYSKGFEISLTKRRRPAWIQPIQYSFMFHPFSYVVIHFPITRQISIKYPAIYETDPVFLLKALTEWGLLDNSNNEGFYS